MDKILYEWKIFLQSIDNIKKDRIDKIAQYAKQDANIRSASMSVTSKDSYKSDETNSADLVMAIQVLNEINNFEKIKIIDSLNYINNEGSAVSVISNAIQIKLPIMEVSDDNVTNSFLIKELVNLFNDDNILTIYVYQLFSHRTIIYNRESSINVTYISRYKIEYLNDKKLKLFIDQGL